MIRNMRLDATTALTRARRLAARRSILGLAGPPAAGKSTYAETLVTTLRAEGYAVALVPMDGFHLAQAVLESMGLAEVKGAPETFDALGYVALLSRLRQGGNGTVWAPRFDRHLEDSIAGSIGVDPSVTLVVTEGNYLLYDEGPWAAVRPLLDECWYIDLDDDVRRERLLSRHIRHGWSPEQAQAKTYGSDEENAKLITTTRGRADAVLEL